MKGALTALLRVVTQPLAVVWLGAVVLGIELGGLWIVERALFEPLQHGTLGTPWSRLWWAACCYAPIAAVALAAAAGPALALIPRAVVNTPAPAPAPAPQRGRWLAVAPDASLIGLLGFAALGAAGLALGSVARAAWAGWAHGLPPGQLLTGSLLGAIAACLVGLLGTLAATLALYRQSGSPPVDRPLWGQRVPAALGTALLDLLRHPLRVVGVLLQVALVTAPLAVAGLVALRMALGQWLGGRSVVWALGGQALALSTSWLVLAVRTGEALSGTPRSSTLPDVGR